MKKTLRLSESDLVKIVKRVLSEQTDGTVELDAMKEIQSKIEEFMNFVEGKCMEIYNDKDRCERAMKIISSKSLNDIHTDYENIFSNN